MFLCMNCHKKDCDINHLFTSYGTCEDCRTTTTCFDCKIHHKEGGDKVKDCFKCEHYPVCEIRTTVEAPFKEPKVLRALKYNIMDDLVSLVGINCKFFEAYEECKEDG